MTASPTLTQKDIDMFAGFGIGLELLDAAGVCRVTDPEARAYGFSLADHPTADLSGIVFPYRHPVSGQRVTARLRRDRPEVDSEGKARNKYLTAWRDNRHVFFSPGAGASLSDVAVPVLPMESEKAALAVAAVAARAGLPLLPLGTGGCWGWRGKTGIHTGPNGDREQTRGPVPDLGLISFVGRRVFIIFDSNVATNPQVARARQCLAETLTTFGAYVFLVNIPLDQGTNGPDDFIARHGDQEFLALMDNAEEYRPTITLSAGECPQAVDQAEEILGTHAERLRIFQRGSEIVRVVTLENAQRRRGLERQAGIIQLAPVSSIALTEIWDRLIVWQRLRETKDGTEAVRVDCPGRIAEAYRSRIASWRLPLLVGIVSAPIMRHDGTVLCRAGYDPATGLLLTEDWPELDGEPTRDHALAALRQLEGPFSEFPFVGPEDRSVLLAAIATAVQRRLLPSAPLFGIKAPSQRTGKSLLAECIARIATGQPAPAMAVSGDREEMRKAVAAALREGHAIVNLDNIEHALGSPDLSRAITEPEYSDRLLGETKTFRVPTNLLWVATGNNLTFRGDLAVRALVCRLDARMERPEERQFKIEDLKQYVSDHRRELVTAAITILRAYVVAGTPDQQLKPWGGFNEWSQTVRSAVVWLGVPDPCKTRYHVIDDDPDREQAAALLSAWHSAVGSEAVQIATVIERAARDPELKTSVLAVAGSKDDTNRPDPRRLTWWCREWRDRVVGGLTLVRGRDYGKAATWRVESAQSSGITGISGVRNTPRNSEGKETAEGGQFFQGENNPINPSNPTAGHPSPRKPDDACQEGAPPVLWGQDSHSNGDGCEIDNGWEEVL
jgi:putative DNA primase/helicase